MTAAADLTPESTIDQPGEAEPTVAEPTVDATVDQPGGGDEPDGTEPVVDQLTETEPGVDEGAATEADAAEQPDPEPQDAGPSAEAEAAPEPGSRRRSRPLRRPTPPLEPGSRRRSPPFRPRPHPSRGTPAAELDDDGSPPLRLTPTGSLLPSPWTSGPLHRGRPSPSRPHRAPRRRGLLPASRGAASTRTAPCRCAKATSGASWGSTRTGRRKRRSPITSASSPTSPAKWGFSRSATVAGAPPPRTSAARRRTVNAKLEGAAAVGDLASLTARVAALTQSLAAASESEAAAARAAVDDAVRSRTELVEKVEAIAARDPRSVQWKQASAEVSALFDQWQSEQQNGPRLPKSTAQQLWKRFRDARATFDKHRREFYAELDEAHKGVRDRKTRLVERAEALSSKGEDGIPAYRELLDEWKTAGRAGKKIDDALWARFKAAGDALYSARIERESADAAASRENIEAKRALLEEARAVTDERDIAKARTLLTGVQRQWDEIGRIFPRDAERALDDELRKIEQASADPRGSRLEAEQPRNEGAGERHDPPAHRGDPEARGRTRRRRTLRKQGCHREGVRGARGAAFVAQRARRLKLPPKSRSWRVVHSRARQRCGACRVGDTSLMASPFLYFADDRLSQAELTAACLDGDLVELGEAYIPADAVETTGLRAGSLSEVLGESLAATHLTAAWIHGAPSRAAVTPHGAAGGPTAPAPGARPATGLP